MHSSGLPGRQQLLLREGWARWSNRDPEKKANTEGEGRGVCHFVLGAIKKPDKLEAHACLSGTSSARVGAGAAAWDSCLRGVLGVTCCVLLREQSGLSQHAGGSRAQEEVVPLECGAWGEGSRGRGACLRVKGACGMAPFLLTVACA